MYYNTKTRKFDPCCGNPDVEFSKITCACCWYCHNCGGRGCTNLAGVVDGIGSLTTLKNINLPISPTPLPPTPPLNRLLREDGSSVGTCPKCESSMLRTKWFFFGNKKCIHPKCGFEEK